MKTDIDNGLFHCRLFNAIRQQRGGALTNGAAVDAVGGDRRAIAGGKIEVAKTDDGQILRNTSSTAFRFHHCPLRQGIGTADNHVKFPFAEEFSVLLPATPVAFRGSHCFSTPDVILLADTRRPLLR